MFFALLTFFSAFLIEGIGTYVSILGLSALFAFNPVIVAMAVALDIGKIVAVSFLYKSWNKINILMKSYMMAASIILMIITSMGVFGFLSGEFQKAISGNQQQTLIIDALQEERDRLQARKQQIDDQIASLPERFTANQRVRMIAQFRQEQRAVTTRLAEIDKQLPELKINNIDKQVKIGPILYVAEAFGTTPEQAAKWVILIIIFVFDPLAIALILAGNFLWEHRVRNRQVVPDPAATQVSYKEPESDTDFTATRDLHQDHNPTVEPVDNVSPIEEQPVSEIQPVIKKKKVLNRKPKKLANKELTKDVAKKSITKKKKNDVKSKVVEDIPPVRSLTDIDARRSDVTIDDDVRHPRAISGIIDQYKDNSPAVSVGGPPTKI